MVFAKGFMPKIAKALPQNNLKNWKAWQTISKIRIKPLLENLLE